MLHSGKIISYLILRGIELSGRKFRRPSVPGGLLPSVWYSCGFAIAVSATAVILWRKAKKKVANVLHIDENANKEVEEDIVINEPVEK